MMKKKVDNQIRNDLQMSHAIAIYLVFKKLSEKKQKKHFWFKTLKLLTLQFQKNSGWARTPPQVFSPSLLPLLLFIPSRTFNVYLILISSSKKRSQAILLSCKQFCVWETYEVQHYRNTRYQISNFLCRVP